MVSAAAAHATPYKRLAFESDLLGVGVYRLTDTSALRTPKAVTSIAEDLKRAGCWLAWTRVAEDDSEAGVALASNGFRPIETLVTFEKPLTNESAAPGIIVAGPKDAEACAAVAQVAFTMDRMHRDPEVPKAIADAVRRAWVVNNLEGRADHTFIDSHGGRISGFINCLLAPDAAVIDLIAVDPKDQGKGVGSRLVRASLAHYDGKRPLMRVGTQADNIVSVKLYKAAGFQEVKREITFHRIFKDAAAMAAGSVA